MILEVISPGSVRKDTTVLRELYARAGIAEYWIVDPASNTLEIYVLRDRGYVLFGSYDEAQDVNSPGLPGRAFAAARVFAE